MNANFLSLRRQPYIDEQSFANTLAAYRRNDELAEEKLTERKDKPGGQHVLLGYIAAGRWREFQLRYTAGDPLHELAAFLAKVVEAYEREAEAKDELPEEEYSAVFTLDDPIDEYVDYIGIISVAALLHREDLIPRVFALMAGTDYDETDLLIEELLNFYLPDRPVVDGWYWEKPYGMLVDVIDSEAPAAKAEAMKRYVARWYPSMKGRAYFWGKHENATPKYSDYVGYWAFCAAAFTYLYDIDDSAYRDELVYPKDLVDYARKSPPPSPKTAGGA
jgi:hypothetical protein